MTPEQLEVARKFPELKFKYCDVLHTYVPGVYEVHINETDYFLLYPNPFNGLSRDEVFNYFKKVVQHLKLNNFK